MKRKEEVLEKLFSSLHHPGWYGQSVNAKIITKLIELLLSVKKVMPYISILKRVLMWYVLLHFNCKAMSAETKIVSSYKMDIKPLVELKMVKL